MTQENRGLFLMLPDCLLDDETLSGNCIIGYARLTRYCQQQYTNIFTGSLSKLARVIKIPKTTAYRLMLTWIDRQLLTKDEDEDGIMTLTLQLDELWQHNVTYCEERYPSIMERSKTKHSNSTVEHNRSKTKHSNSTVEHSNSTVEQIVPHVSTNDPPNTIRDSNTIEDSKKGEEEKNEAPISSSHGKNILPFKPTHTQEQKETVHLSEKERRRAEARGREAREREIWALIERGRKTTYSQRLRSSPRHSKGIEGLIEDGITDDAIRHGFAVLTAKEKEMFSVNLFYEWEPELRTRSMNGNGHVHDPHAGLVYWADRWMTEAEADELGFNGGFNQYVMVPDETQVREEAMR